MESMIFRKLSLVVLFLLGSVACSPSKTIDVAKPETTFNPPAPAKPTTENNEPGPSLNPPKKVTFARLLCDAYGDGSQLVLFRSDASPLDFTKGIDLSDETGKALRSIIDYHILSSDGHTAEVLIANEYNGTARLFSGTVDFSNRQSSLKQVAAFPWINLAARWTYQDQAGGKISIPLSKATGVLVVPDERTGNYQLLNLKDFSIKQNLAVPYSKYWALEINSNFILFGSIQGAADATAQVLFSVYDLKSQKLQPLLPLNKNTLVEMAHLVGDQAIIWREIVKGEVLLVGKLALRNPGLITSLGSARFKNFASISDPNEMMIAVPQEKYKSVDGSIQLAEGSLRLVYIDPSTLAARRESTFNYPAALVGKTVFNGSVLASFTSLESKSQLLFSLGGLGGLQRFDILSTSWTKVGGEDSSAKCFYPDYVWETQEQR